MKKTIATIILMGPLFLGGAPASAQGITDAQIASIVVTANQVDIDAGNSPRPAPPVTRSLSPRHLVRARSCAPRNAVMDMPACWWSRPERRCDDEATHDDSGAEPPAVSVRRTPTRRGGPNPEPHADVFEYSVADLRGDGRNRSRRVHLMPYERGADASRRVEPPRCERAHSTASIASAVRNRGPSSSYPGIRRTAISFTKSKGVPESLGSGCRGRTAPF